ncbi:MAG: chemotaxis protein CheW [Colwellia sp.]
MAKSLAASKKVMQSYLSDLLTDDEIAEVIPSQSATVENKRLEKLLQNVNAEITVSTQQKTVTKRTKAIETKAVLTPLTTHKSSNNIVKAPEKLYRQGNFQALFFSVAGLTIAVPLIELGGIHNVEKTTGLMGKPNWFKGVMLHRDEKINVVDTALWVMPEKCDEVLKNSLNYQYIIMLDNSQWGLTAENLVDTVTLSQDDVKWLDSPSKRPWLAGLVKNRMCALLDVEALIKLLNKGSGIYPENE